MADGNMIVRERQLAVRRAMDKRGISLKVVSLDSGISYSSIVSYFPAEKNKEPAAVPMGVVYTLCETKALPLDLLSLLLPDGFHIVRAPEEIDHDALCELAAEYVAEKNRFHHPDSEAGRDIGPTERSLLTGKVVHLVGSVAA